jgi:hypothetical protein
MKKALLLFTLLVLTGFAKISSADCPCNDWKKAFEAQLQAIEKDRYEAMTSNNYDKLKVVLGDDLVYIHSNGDMQTKSTFIDALKSGAYKYRKIDAEMEGARFYGETAILNGHGTFDVTRKKDGKSEDVTLKVIYTAIYLLRGEGLARHWELISWQTSKIA